MYISHIHVYGYGTFTQPLWPKEDVTQGHFFILLAVELCIRIPFKIEIFQFKIYIYKDIVTMIFDQTAVVYCISFMYEFNSSATGWMWN